MPLPCLPALPTDGIFSAHGKPLGGFPVEVSGERMDCTKEQWRSRLEVINECCGKIWTGKGKGRNKVLEERENLTAQNFGNIRHDVTFALRHGSRAGLDVLEPMRMMLLALIPALRNRYPGIIVGGLVVHPPNPYVDEAERRAAGGVRDSASGMNLHPQLYSAEAFAGERTSTRRKGFTHLLEYVVAGLQHDQIGIDVHKYARLRKEVRLEWWYREAKRKDIKVLAALEPGAAQRVRNVRKRVKSKKTTIEIEVASDLSRWDAKWINECSRSKCQLDVFKRDLATATRNGVEPINWWMSRWATAFLEEELPKLDPRWTEHLLWGRRAAKTVLERHMESRFSTPLLALLQKFESESEAERVKAEIDRAEARVRLADESINAAMAMVAKSTKLAKSRKEQLDAAVEEIAVLKSQAAAPEASTKLLRDYANRDLVNLMAALRVVQLTQTTDAVQDATPFSELIERGDGTGGFALTAEFYVRLENVRTALGCDAVKEVAAGAEWVKKIYSITSADLVAAAKVCRAMRGSPDFHDLGSSSVNDNRDAQLALVAAAKASVFQQKREINPVPAVVERAEFAQDFLLEIEVLEEIRKTTVLKLGDNYRGR